jgi:hypothetical protein
VITKAAPLSVIDLVFVTSKQNLRGPGGARAKRCTRAMLNTEVSPISISCSLPQVVWLVPVVVQWRFAEFRRYPSIVRLHSYSASMR